MDDYFYAYLGSNTYPTTDAECAEIVWTYVSRKIYPLKSTSLTTITDGIAYTGSNNRNIQDIGDRKLYLTGHPCNPDVPNNRWQTWFTHKLNT